MHINTYTGMVSESEQWIHTLIQLHDCTVHQHAEVYNNVHRVTQWYVITMSHSLNCSSVVSASLGCVSLDPVGGSGVPPNTVTSVSPGPRLKAVRECQ